MIAAAVVITPGVYIDNLADSKTLLPKERAAAYQSLVSHPQVFMATCAPLSVYPGCLLELRCRISHRILAAEIFGFLNAHMIVYGCHRSIKKRRPEQPERALSNVIC